MKATVGFLFFLLFLAGLALVNLGKFEPPTVDLEPPTAERLLGAAWELRALRDTPAAARAGITLQFTRGGLLAVDGACNRLTGDYHYAAGEFAVERITATKRACPAPAMAADAALASALQAADRAMTDGRQLILLSGDERLARFAPAGPVNGDP